MILYLMLLLSLEMHSQTSLTRPVWLEKASECRLGGKEEAAPEHLLCPILGARRGFVAHDASLATLSWEPAAECVLFHNSLSHATHTLAQVCPGWSLITHSHHHLFVHTLGATGFASTHRSHQLSQLCQH